MFQAIGIGLLAIIVLIGFVYLFRKTAETSASAELDPTPPPSSSGEIEFRPYIECGHTSGEAYSRKEASTSPSLNIIEHSDVFSSPSIEAILEDDVPYGSYLLRAGIIELDDLRRLSTLDEVDGIGRVTGLEVREALKKADRVPDEAIPPITTRD